MVINRNRSSSMSYRDLVDFKTKLIRRLLTLLSLETQMNVNRVELVYPKLDNGELT
jgi:hypothetical protein